MLKNPKTRAVMGILLCLPAALLFLFMLLGVEPPIGPLVSYLGGSGNGPDVPGTVIAGLFFVVFPLVAFFLNNFVGGKTKVNQAVAAFSLGIVVAAITAVVVDQYPCWTGKPNCD